MIPNISSNYDNDIKIRFAMLFSKNLSEPIKYFEINIIMKADAVPIFFSANTVLFGLTPKVEEIYKKKVKMGLLDPVRNSC